jgi:hypothetical protein
MNDLDAAGIAFVHASTNEVLWLSQKPSGSTWNLPVGFSMADRGHQGFTLWSFYVYWMGLGNGSEQIAAGGKLYRDVQDGFNVKVTAHKGILPYEPLHKDFWQGNRTATVIPSQSYSPSDTSPWQCPDCGWRPKPPALVPPGTGSLSMKLDWAAQVASGVEECGDLNGKWTLAVHPANLPAKGYTSKDLIQLQPTSTSNSVPTCSGTATFEMLLAGVQTDAFYQTKSNWVFFLVDPSETNQAGSSVHTYYGLQWTLKVTANLNPKYVYSAK